MELLSTFATGTRLVPVEYSPWTPTVFLPRLSHLRSTGKFLSLDLRRTHAEKRHTNDDNNCNNNDNTSFASNNGGQDDVDLIVAADDRSLTFGGHFGRF